MIWHRFESGAIANLWWSVSPGGVVADACSQSNALVFGTNLTERVAVTRPLAISFASATQELLQENFDSVNDVARLVNEGYVTAILMWQFTNICTWRWEVTGQISSLCGFLHGNRTALTFVTADVREVITKPIDATNASHVSFYLLFGISQFVYAFILNTIHFICSKHLSMQYAILYYRWSNL